MKIQKIEKKVGPIGKVVIPIIGAVIIVDRKSVV